MFENKNEEFHELQKQWTLVQKKFNYTPEKFGDLILKEYRRRITNNPYADYETKRTNKAIFSECFHCGLFHARYYSSSTCYVCEACLEEQFRTKQKTCEECRPDNIIQRAKQFFEKEGFDTQYYRSIHRSLGWHNSSEFRRNSMCHIDGTDDKKKTFNEVYNYKFHLNRAQKHKYDIVKRHSRRRNSVPVLSYERPPYSPDRFISWLWSVLYFLEKESSSIPKQYFDARGRVRLNDLREYVLTLSDSSLEILSLRLKRHTDGTCKLEVGVADVEKAKQELPKLDWIVPVEHQKPSISL